MILPDLFWRAWGRRVVSPYDPRLVNPTSYDLMLDVPIRLQRYRGVEYPDTLAYLSHFPGQFAFPGEPPSSMQRVQTLPFQPGDSILATTRERLYVPRWVRLQGMLKSSVARAGLNHRTALYIDPGFVGNITLELQFDRSGWLVPGTPIIQVEASLALPWRPYGHPSRRSHYQGQAGTVGNRNPHVAFRPLHATPEELP